MAVLFLSEFNSLGTLVQILCLHQSQHEYL